MVRSDQNLPRRHHWSTFALSEPPAFLYRVQYDGSDTSYSWVDGLEATSRDNIYEYDNFECHDRLKRHLNWTKDPRCPSHMISTFGSRVHAENWARRWAEKHSYGEYYIHRIEVSSCYEVFRAVELVNVLNTPLHPGVKPAILRDEYLIFGNVEYIHVSLIDSSDRMKLSD